MKLHELKAPPGARKPRKRVGRGIGSGHGKTSTRGHKGQKARSGGQIPAWFEGGQNPLIRRIPLRRGFRNPFRVEYNVINVGRLGELFPDGGEVTPEVLRQMGILKRNRPLKILGDGELKAALTVKAHRFSKSAREKILAAGGQVEELPLGTGAQAE